MTATIVFDKAKGKFVGSVNGKVVIRTKYEWAAKNRVNQLSGGKVDFEAAAKERAGAVCAR